MYSLSIFFGPSPVPAQFLFKEMPPFESLKTAWHTGPAIVFTDDFGQSAYFLSKNVHALVLEDLVLGEESRIQRGLSQARGQANANKRALTDPVLQAAARGQGGPSVLTPFGRNGFNG